MDRSIGIHLGTSNACAAVFQDGKSVIIPNSDGAPSTPFCVAFTKSGQQLLGQSARHQALLNPENTAYSLSNFIGRAYSEVQSEIASVSYKLSQGPDDSCRIDMQGKLYTVEEISAMIICKLKEDAENYLAEPVSSAVIAVPPYFTDKQKQATKNAVELAGLHLLRIVNETSAAAIAYDLSNDTSESEYILVFHLGGATATVTILEATDGIFEQKSMAIDNNLGGNDFDLAIVDWLVVEFQRIEGIPLHKGRPALHRLSEAAQKAKIELSAITETNIWLPSITADKATSWHMDIKFTRQHFNELIKPFVDRCRALISQAVADANIPCPERVVLTGGSTRIPVIQDMIKDLTGKQLTQSQNPDEVAALGAAFQASYLGAPTSCPRLLACEIAFEDLFVVLQNMAEEHDSKSITPKIKITSSGYTGNINSVPEVSFRVGKYTCVWRLATMEAILQEFYLETPNEITKGQPQRSYQLTLDTAILKGKSFTLKQLAQNALDFIVLQPDPQDLAVDGERD